MNQEDAQIAGVFTLRLLNEAAVRKHALKCSQICRNGKYTRVGQEFIDELLADVESSLVRAIEVQSRTTLHEPVSIEDLSFVTGNLRDRIMERVDRCIGRMIQNKVQRQTTGVTLTRTR